MNQVRNERSTWGQPKVLFALKFFCKQKKLNVLDVRSETEIEDDYWGIWGPSGWSEDKFLAYPPFWTTSVSRWISAFLAPPPAVLPQYIQVAGSVIGGDDCGNAIQTWRRAAENLGKEIIYLLEYFSARWENGIRRWNFNGTRGKVMKSNCEKNYFEIFFSSGQRWWGWQLFSIVCNLFESMMKIGSKSFSNITIRGVD